MTLLAAAPPRLRKNLLSLTVARKRRNRQREQPNKKNVELTKDFLVLPTTQVTWNIDLY
jgi:hypothetical protein